ncbi:uncharacterized protein LOC129611621 [Condylostylus longicornis]|uniref:uncharacterized protein LOC129611621 n=1 Tax=Condylostylus longicornis TaxID=2530218 RepID=UPI00244E55AC|nr:uncharacterized protein LOC129611621 [Condylostylus longicornis]
MKAEFKAKILSGNVIIVESKGFDPELFVPVIRKNRITLLNFIENRRCACENINQTSISNVKSLSKTSSLDLVETLDQNRGSALSPPDIVRRCKEINVLTPIKVQQNYLKSKVSSISPINKFKVVELFRNPTKDSPKKVGKLILNRQSIQNECSIQNDFPNPAFKENINPIAYSETDFSTPPSKKSKICKKQYRKSPKRSITKWRKCITPLRTYSRKQIFQNTKKNQPPTPRVVPIEDIDLPDYVRNPTAGICSDVLVIIRKKKLIRDSKIHINAKKITEQLCNTSDLQQKKVCLPKLKAEFNNSKYLQPYDLLTNLCRKNISSKLTEMFKTRCVKKSCSTRPNYLKLIGKIDDLEKKNVDLLKQKCLEPRKLVI